VYLAGAALAGAGFADYPLIAYHLQKSSTVGSAVVLVFYALAMAVSGLGSLAFGRLFDRAGIGVLVPLTLLSALYAPLAFLGGFWVALVGVAIWGLGMGVQESIMAAAVAPMVSPDRRSSAYGLFTGIYGIAWFFGSVAIGALYEASLTALVAFSVIAELLAVPFLLVVRARTKPPVTVPET
jgi:predicted MFS family arabinose efflux permease